VKDTTVAARYARALFIVTEKRGETERALADLAALAELLRPGTAAGRLMATPQVLLADKRKALLEVLKGRALDSVALFGDLLLRKKRIRELDTIVAEFEALVEKKQGVKRAQVVSAVPLEPAELQRLHAELERTTGAKIKLTTDVDPGLLGGALVRIGDRVIDRTVKSLLESIEEQLLHTVV
jgi:F-type H+-transporting ATPase subunit delta